MKTLRNVGLTLALLVALTCLLLGPPVAGQTNPATFRAPSVYTGAVATSIYWTAGHVANGGHLVTVAAGNAALGAGLTSCASPNYPSCDILYANSVGTVAVTTSITTAADTGNTIMAYIETSGGSVPTSVTTSEQSSLMWNASGGPVYTNCGNGLPGACGNTDLGRSERVLMGRFTFDNTGAASHATITGMPYVSPTSYYCAAFPTGAADAITDLYVIPDSASSVTFYKTASSTAVYAFTCIGK